MNAKLVAATHHEMSIMKAKAGGGGQQSHLQSRCNVIGFELKEGFREFEIEMGH